MQNFYFVLFGATGDLAMRKIFPSMYQAYAEGFLLPLGKIIGTSRRVFTKEGFLEELSHKAKIHIKNCDESKWEEFTQNIDYISIELNNKDCFMQLKEHIEQSNQNIVIYFSISPEFFIQACKNLAAVGLNSPNIKIVLEKPLGMDLKSCQAIHTEIAKYYQENQIYRIDHYLGKESIQNLLILRAFNPIFASLWNKEHINYVEISVFETLGVETRGEFYDNTGALRDMVQNHILQILALVAMKIPKQMDSESIRNAKLALLRALKPLSVEDVKHQVIRAQYTKGAEFKAYLAEDNIRAKSQTETFVAIKAELLDENWQGVPFYIRTGKRMADSFAQIVLSFKNNGFLNVDNKLLIRLQPDNQISLILNVKKTGKTKEYEERKLNLDLDNKSVMQAYERLILDVIESNPTSFNHKEELEAAWAWIDPILKGWENKQSPLFNYCAGSWGPKEAFDLIRQDGYEWYNL